MEQDFGFYEGKSVCARPPKGGIISGKEAHHKDDAAFVDMESKESMALRADTFLDDYLLPVMEEKQIIVAVVSHGIMLSALWRRLLQRLPARSVMIHPQVVAMHGQLDIERFGGWSNTGYLELDMSLVASSTTNDPSPASVDAVVKVNVAPVTPSVVDSTRVEVSDSVSVEELTPQKHFFTICQTTITAVNQRAHLNGLKRTRGGVGSSRHDEKQKSINSFFKKTRRE